MAGARFFGLTILLASASACISWSTTTLKPAVSSGDFVGFGVESHVVTASLGFFSGQASVVAESLANHSSRAPIPYMDSYWRGVIKSTESFEVEFCSHNSKEPGWTCEKAEFPDGPPQDIPRFVSPVARGGATIVGGNVVGAHRSRDEDNPMPALKNRGLYAVAGSIFFCSIATGQPVCRKAVDPGRIVVAAVVRSEGGERRSVIWTATMANTSSYTGFRVRSRCEAGDDGVPRCEEVKYE